MKKDEIHRMFSDVLLLDNEMQELKQLKEDELQQYSNGLDSSLNELKQSLLRETDEKYRKDLEFSKSELERSLEQIKEKHTLKIQCLELSMKQSKESIVSKIVEEVTGGHFE